jgi:hypothetical protein
MPSRYSIRPVLLGPRESYSLAPLERLQPQGSKELDDLVTCTEVATVNDEDGSRVPVVLLSSLRL